MNTIFEYNLKLWTYKDKEIRSSFRTEVSPEVRFFMINKTLLLLLMSVTIQLLHDEHLNNCKIKHFFLGLKIST